MALINGDFTMNEANALKDISDLLISYCDHQGVVAGKVREYHPEMVTPLNQTGYYQPSVDEKNTEQVNPLSSSNSSAPKPKTEEVVPNITLNLNIVPEQPTEPIASVPASGVSIKKTASKDSDEAEETLESVLAELNGLVGLDKVKNDIRSLLNFIKICQMRTRRGMKVPTISYHLVFTGNPGTGKTAVARMVAKL